MNPIRKRLIIALASVAALLSMSMGFAAAPLTIVWQGSPIPIELATAVEQRIDFPQDIASLDLPNGFEQHATALLSPNGILHLSVSEPVSNARVFATSVRGDVYILDVSASSEVGAKAITLIDPSLHTDQPHAMPHRPSAQVGALPHTVSRSIPGALPTAPQQPAAMTYVDLARFAMAHHMGPERLIPEWPSATPIGLKHQDLSRFVRLSPGLSVSPMRQWRINGLYVTTVLAKNASAHARQFDARALRGDFLFAATASLVLDGHGAETVWALISQHPFSVAAHRLNPRSRSDNTQVIRR